MKWWIVATFFAAFTAPALAADGASFQAIGYSPDSRYFAFEQYGIQDGSGFPYADIFVIDLEHDEWVKGSPFHEMDESDSATAGPVLAKARAKAAPILAAFKISEPAELLAANPATEVMGDRLHLTFDRYYNSMGGGSELKTFSPEIRRELTLTTISQGPTAACTADYENVYRFSLDIRNLGTGDTRSIYTEDALPPSRGCPLRYDIAAVYAPVGYPQIAWLVAIISVYTPGFEGQDRRYVAVSFQYD